MADYTDYKLKSKNKTWWNVFADVDGKKTVLAKVKSKGLAYIIMQRLTEIYGKAGME